MIEAWVSGAATAAALAIAWFAHVRWIGWIPEDVANARRKQHANAIPLIGFVPALASVIVCALHDRPWLAAGCAVAGIVGFLDDRNKHAGDGIDWRAKAAGLVLASTLGWMSIEAPAPIDSVTALALWGCVFVIANAVNFLDNVHGVAATLGGLALWLGGDPTSIALAACWFAFLPFNWPHGRLFLGDSGALSLGLLVGATTASRAVATGVDPDWFAMIAPAAIFWVDFVQVITARLWLGYAPWVADRRHLTHIAGNLGLPTWAQAPLFLAFAGSAHVVLSRFA
ncbi:MAG: hypothetical protein KDB80_05740 [Planctomycetes bacterium]|nr:hypothetical protein [Planctomycetota bacterium]